MVRVENTTTRRWCPRHSNHVCDATLIVKSGLPSYPLMRNCVLFYSRWHMLAYGSRILPVIICFFSLSWQIKYISILFIFYFSILIPVFLIFYYVFILFIDVFLLCNSIIPIYFLICFIFNLSSYSFNFLFHSCSF